MSIDSWGMNRLFLLSIYNTDPAIGCIFIACLFLISSCTAQTEQAIELYSIDPIELPVSSFYEGLVDTLSKREVNEFLFNQSYQEPYFINKDGERLLDDHYGRYPEDVSVWGTGKDRFEFTPKVFPVGMLDWSQEYDLIVLSIITDEARFTDLWVLKNEIPVSFLCLAYELRNEGPETPDPTYYEVIKSKINEDRTIQWHEDDRGLETYRTIILDDSGLLRVIKERQVGEYEY